MDSLLWEVISPQHVKSYVFGTMHVRDLDAFPSMEKIRTCIEKVAVYYSELEMVPGEMESLYAFQRLPNGMELSDLMSAHKYSRLRASISKSFGLDIDHFSQFYPVITANVIQTSILNNTSDVILDYYLYQNADRAENEMRFLESQEEQLALFLKIPLEYQVRALIQIGRQPSMAKKQILALMKDYAQVNTRQLYQRSRKQLGKLRHLLLYKRNERMAEKLIVELQDTSAFVGVGAAHLFGYKGILRLMKEAGYKVVAG